MEEDQEPEEPDPLIEKRVRRFWKTLSSMMDPPVYGADAAGTLFGGAEACGWNVDELDTPLRRHSLPIQGVTSSMLYVGQWAAMFAWHVEDMNLYSINYIHTGAPKSWYSVKPQHAQRFENMAQALQPEDAGFCPEFLRHKRFLFSPAVLKEHGIGYDTVLHHAGEFVLTFPLSYHAGFNHGFNIAESSNFATKEWASGPGACAGVCECSPDSVCINLVDFKARMDAGFVVGKDGGGVVFADGTVDENDFLFLDYGNADGEGRSAATGGGGVGGGAQPGKAAKGKRKQAKKKKKDDSLLSPIFGEHLLNKKKRPRVKAQAKEALRVGQSVEVQWSDGTWYPGVVLRLNYPAGHPLAAAGEAGTEGMGAAVSTAPATKMSPKKGRGAASESGDKAATGSPEGLTLCIMYDSGETENSVKCNLVRSVRDGISLVSWPPSPSSSSSSSSSSSAVAAAATPTTPLAKQAAPKKTGSGKKQRRVTSKPCSLRPTFFSPRDDVQIRWNDGKWYPARVDSIAGDGSASVTYATGQSEIGVSPEWMRRIHAESEGVGSKPACASKKKRASSSSSSSSSLSSAAAAATAVASKKKKPTTAAGSREEMDLALAISASMT